MESEVAQIMADVNKYLRFAHPEGDDPEWLDLLDALKVSAYIGTLESTSACVPAARSA